MKNIINDFESSFFLHVLYSRRIKFKTKTCFRSILILSSHTRLFLSIFLFVSGYCIKNLCARSIYIMRASRPPVPPSMRPNAVSHSLLNYHTSLLVNWLPPFRNKFTHTSPWSDMFFNICTVGHETTRLYRNVQYQLPSATT